MSKLNLSLKMAVAMILVAVSVFSSSAYAQEAEKTGPWHHSILGGLALSQVAYKDWAQGGEATLAWTASLDGKSAHDLTKTNWANTYKLAYGQTKLGDGDFLKTDDKIDLESILTYKSGFYVNPYTAATLKTQFFEGLQYDDAGEGTKVSKFFDPAYLTQSAGLGYQPIPQLKTRLGGAIREIMTDEFNQYADDPETDEIEKTRFDVGMESVTEAEWNLKENILFKSKLEIFAALTTPRDVAIRSDSTLAIKVSKNVSVNLNLLIVKDDTLGEDTQIKESLALGFSYIFVD